jgi:phage-related baseplate assembly protein
MLNLRDLLEPRTEDQLFDSFIGLLAAAGFPVTSWHVGGIARTLARLVARGLVKVSEIISLLAKGGFNSYAEKDWLTLLSREVYQNGRSPAEFARGQILLGLSSALAGPYTIVPGQLWLFWNGKRYRNTSGTPAGSPLTYPDTVTLSFQAESPGAAWNAPDNQLSLTTPLAGMVLLASTITIQGTDPERDISLRERNRGRWGTTGVVANEDGWATYTREASAQVTRVVVLEDTPEDGQVQVVVAGVAGALSGPTLTSINGYLDGRRPMCVRVAAVNATEQAVSLTGVVRIKASHPNAASALAQVIDALNVYFAELPIGGVVRVSDLYALIEAVPGVDSSFLSVPLSDVPLGALSVADPTISLTPEYF